MPLYDKDNKCLHYKMRIQSEAAILGKLIAKKRKTTEHGSASADCSILDFLLSRIISKGCQKEYSEVQK